jgi:hypothetical protein
MLDCPVLRATNFLGWFPSGYRDQQRKPPEYFDMRGDSRTKLFADFAT